MGGTYSVASGVFLLSANHETGSLGCVEGAAALDDGFALDTAGTVLGADASNVVPVLVGHFYDLRISMGEKRLMERSVSTCAHDVVETLIK